MAGDRHDATSQAVHGRSRVLFCRYRVCQTYARQSGDYGWVAAHPLSDAGLSSGHANAAWTIAQGLPWQPDRYFCTSTGMFFCLPMFPGVMQDVLLDLLNPSRADAVSMRLLHFSYQQHKCYLCHIAAVTQQESSYSGVLFA